MRRAKFKCKSRGQSTNWCDARCKQSIITKCPFRDKFRDFRHSKKGESMYGSLKEYFKFPF